MSDKQDYQSMNNELQEILGKLQQDDLDVDEAMQAYERGLELVTALETYLKQAENKVSKLQAKPGKG